VARDRCASVRGQAPAFFAWDLIFAHRFLAACEMFALPAADNTRFFAVAMSRLAVLPRALAADCNPPSRCVNLSSCFLTLFSSRRIAVNMLIDPPWTIYKIGNRTSILRLGWRRQRRVSCRGEEASGVTGATVSFVDNSEGAFRTSSHRAVQGWSACGLDPSKSFLRLWNPCTDFLDVA
jgi:hypothetical protein